jgi:hypothetical protein
VRGPYLADLHQHYERSKWAAEGWEVAARGKVILNRLFMIEPGLDHEQMAALASRLGIGDPWDLSLHKIDPGRVDFAGLEAFFASVWKIDSFAGPHREDLEEELAAELAALRAFAGRGFDLFFSPGLIRR